MSHFHASKSILTPDDKSNTEPEKKSSESHKQEQCDTFIFDESSLNSDICPAALKMAHLKESLSFHDEAQRLQRMCRDLKVREGS